MLARETAPARLGLPGDCDDKLELADGTVLGPPGTSPTELRARYTIVSLFLTEQFCRSGYNYSM